MDSGFGRNSIRRTRSRYNIKKAREKDKKKELILKKKRYYDSKLGLGCNLGKNLRKK